MSAIVIEGLEKAYTVGFWRKRRKWGLKPLHLRVETGEIFGYLGPNGAGKTTTLKLLMGLIFPTGGSATIMGRDIRDAAARAEIGFLPEQPYFYDYLTGRELLHYYAQLAGVPAGDRAARATAMLERVGLTGAADMQLRKYSKGMLQRAGIAQAILHDPKLVFLDEPMSGLDPIGRREVRDLIEQLKTEGKTVFFSTHILSDAEALCDRVAVLNGGEVRAVGSVAELAASTGGRYEVTWHGNKDALQALGAQAHVSGDATRAVIAEAELDRAIDLVRAAKAKLISVIPVRKTLEDYFLSQMGEADTKGTEARR